MFQSEVGAYTAALLLTERPLSRLGNNLPGTPLKLFMESPSDVDDVNVVTDKGLLYFQAKNTISLSGSADSDLASVVDQFVRQYRAGVPVGNATRVMDVRSDRLVLAVGGSTAATVRTDLRLVLEKNRTGAATAIPKKEQDALDIVTDQVKSVWLKIVGTPISPSDLQGMLKLFTVVVLDESQKLLATEALREVVATNGDEIPLFSQLVTWATEASALGTGGDESAIRLYMQGRTALKEPPSFNSDVQKLTDHSKLVLKRLERFTTINTDSGDIQLTRPVTSIAVEAAKAGHLAITGDPGAGKSAIMHELSNELAKDAFVVTLTVESNLNTSDALRTQLGLEHSLIEVCRNIPVFGKAYLVIDALDATRGGAAEVTYRQLINGVSAIPNWHVVASIRTFDLKLGLEWKKLFRGTVPDAAFSDPQFQTVRHVHIPLLVDEELGQIEAKSSSLKIALAVGGEKVIALARNPFNLSLISELISSGTSPASLAAVSSRSDLLSRYWDERVEVLGLRGTVALKTFSELVITARTIDIPETEIPLGSAEYIELLQVNGVLVTEQTRRVAFRHHILLDYAISRLLLEPDQPKAIALLSKTSGVGLLISPSLEYWIAYLKRNHSPEQFWKLLSSLISSPETDPIIRVEVSRLAISSVVPGENLASLSRTLSATTGEEKTAIRHLAGTISTFGLINGLPDDWALMIADISNVTEPIQLSSLNGMTSFLLEQPITDTGMKGLGKVSRMIFDKISQDDDLIRWLSTDILTALVKTYSTDPEGSSYRLEQIFSPERFEKHGHLEVPALSRHAAELAVHDRKLVGILYRKAFDGGDFSSDQQTGLGPSSWILPLRSNAAQDFHLAEYVLSTEFPKILTQSPENAFHAFGAAIDGKRDRWRSQEEKVEQVGFLQTQHAFREDNSLYEQLDAEHDALGRMYNSLMAWVENAAPADLIQLPEHLLAETDKALAWKILFIAGKKRPEIIGKLMWNSALDPNVLSSLSTRKSAIDLVAATYTQVEDHEKQQAEEKILNYDFSHTRFPEDFYLDTVSKLFSAIGRENLVSDKAREFLDEASKETPSIPNEEPLDFGSAGQPLGIPDRENDENTEKVGVPGSISDLPVDSPGEVAGDELSEAFDDEEVLAVTEIFSEGSDEGKIALNDLESIAKVLQDIASTGEMRSKAIQGLLDFSSSPFPMANQQVEEQFERSQIWSGDAVRVDVANKMGELIVVPGIWPEISARFEGLLLQDTHPAVRMQSVLHLTKLWDIDRQAMWTLAEKFVENEQNRGVLGYGAYELSRLKGCGAEKLEPLILKLSEKKPTSDSHANLPATIAHLAFVKALPASRAVLSKWITEFDLHKDDLYGMLFSLRDYYAMGYAEGDDRGASIRKPVVSFIFELIATLKPIIISWPLDREPTEREVDALKIWDEIGTQLFYAVGYGDSAFGNNAEQQAFLDEYGPVISELSTLGTPNTVHHCLQVLEKLVAGNPESCFDLISEAMLRKTGVAKYEYERMGAELFVKLVGIYLADYRYIFTDPQRRTNLVECLAVFVEAGWPQARRLFQTLPELR